MRKRSSIVNNKIIGFVILLGLLVSLVGCGVSSQTKAMISLSEDDVFDNMYYVMNTHSEFSYDSVTRYVTDKAIIYYVAYSGIGEYEIPGSSGIEKEPFATHAIYYISIEDDTYHYCGMIIYANKNGADKYNPESKLYILDEYNAALIENIETKDYSADEISVALAEAETREKNDSTSVVTTAN